MKNKVFYLLVLGVSIMCLIFSLSACEKNKQIDCINDFSEYASMTREADRIEVTFDNNTGTPFYFTIEDKDDIDEIMEIIFSASFNKMEKEVNGGDHTSMKIIQGENEYNLHAFMNKEGRYYYSFTTTELLSKIQELAKEAGAFDWAENMQS